MGFAHVESGPLVRSSYHAKRQADRAQPKASRADNGLGEAQPKASRADNGLGEAQPKASRADK
jgi:hypothetical protein